MAQPRDLRTIGGRIGWIVYEKLKVNQAEFARRLQVKRQQLSRWINNPLTPPGRESLKRIAEEGGVSEAWLQYGSDETVAVARETVRALTQEEKAQRWDQLAAWIDGVRGKGPAIPPPDSFDRIDSDA